MPRRVVVLTGAGTSAESGLATFRDANGLWEGHDVTSVASPAGWSRDPALVLEFYNQRRRQLLEVEPNAAHRALVELERHFDVRIVTQNVDDLHERAGSRHVLHLHGELLKSRGDGDDTRLYDQHGDIRLGDTCEQGFQLRPHVVWFGELVTMLQPAAELVSTADVVLIVGTSMVVYPAAGLVGFAPVGTPVYYVDSNAAPNEELSRRRTLTILRERATTGVRKVVDELIAGTE